MTPQTFELTQERETKNSVRYKNPETDWIVYIPKETLGPKPYPKSITITLEPSDAK